MASAAETEEILKHLDRLASLTDRLAKVRDLADQTDTAVRIQREIEAIRQIVQPLA
jgi:hypothetical protein